MKTPNVVGTAEAAEILSTWTSTISRWQKDGRMPPTVADPAATPVWHRDDIVRKAEGKRINKRKRLDLISVGEAAVICGGVDKSQIGRWRRADRFPSPCIELKAGPLWWRKDIENWQANR